MADTTVGELTSLNSVSGDEYLYGIKASGDVKIVASKLADYVLNTYNFNHNTSNSNVVAGKIVSLQAITDYSTLADKTYPIGSLFWSSSSTSPASLFGGTWAQVKDKFALAAGNTYPAGQDSGVDKVTLTVAELPSHNHGGASGKPSTDATGKSSGNTGNNSADHTHTIPSLTATANKDGGDHTHTVNGVLMDGSGLATRAYYVTGYHSGSSTTWPSAGGHTHTFTTTAKTSGGVSQAHTHTMAHTHELGNHTHAISSQGGGAAHNNMPPYVVKYCWVRVA